MKAPLIHVASLIFNEPLAIMSTKLEAILRVIGPRLMVEDQQLDALVESGVISGTTNAIIEISPAAEFLLQGNVVVNAQGSQNGNGDGKPYQLTPEGVAVIPIRGTLMKRFGFLSSASGFSTYAGLAQAATAALADPQVKGVLFDVDSPGGTTHGCFELSEMLHGMRGDKPMWAIANDLAASAAYALASAADRVWVTRTAGVGSVGVFALHADQSGMDEQAGLKFSYIFAGEKKVDGNPHEPLAKSARADIQAEVDREYIMFVSCVARNRGISPEKIAGKGAVVLYGDNALPMLADEVGTYAEALKALTAKVTGSAPLLTLRAEAPPETGATKEVNQPEGGEAAMAKTEEMKRAAAEDEEVKAAAPKDDEDDDDEPQPKEAKDKPKGKAKAEDDAKCAVTEMPTANNAAKRIAELCQIASAPELTADYIMRGYSVDKVIEKLSARRAKASAEGSVNSFVAGDGGAPGGGGGRASVDSAIEQARIMSANSGGKLTQSQCMEKLLRANPDIYSGYLEEKDRVASQIMYSGGGRVLNEYVLNNQRRYMASLGLGTSIEDMPSRRSM